MVATPMQITVRKSQWTERWLAFDMGDTIHGGQGKTLEEALQACLLDAGQSECEVYSARDTVFEGIFRADGTWL